MNEPLNVIMLLLLILIGCFGFCLFSSADALNRVGRHLRARSCGLLAAREAYNSAWSRSMEADARNDHERAEMRQLFVDEMERQKTA